MSPTSALITLRIALSALTAALVLGTASAAAQPTPGDTTRAAARELGMQGIEAYRAANYADADSKLDKAYRLYAIPTLALWSARARMQLGQWVEAAERYREALRASAALGDAAAQAEAQRDAKAELDELLPRIPAVTIELQGSDGNGVSLRVDRMLLSSELFGVRVLLNPGAHRIVAIRSDKHAAASVQLAEKEHKRVLLRLGAAVEPARAGRQPQAPAAAAPVAPANVAAVSGAADPISSAPDAPPRDGSGVDVRPYAIAGLVLGGIGLATSGVTGIAAESTCSGGGCTSVEDQKSYDPLRMVSLVSFWAGVALAAGGTIAWIAAPNAEGEKPPRSLTWSVSPFGVGVRGSL